MYIEATGKNRGEFARLISPLLRYETHRCITFWYHMYGSPGDLKILVVREHHSETETIWTLSRDQGDKWQQGRASIPDISSNIQVCFYSNHIQHINNIQTLDIAKYYINYFTVNICVTLFTFTTYQI
jgi:hypothetical protein